MDPITHTFTGTALGAAGLRRASPLAVPTLALAANAPDIDVVAFAWGPYASLAWRRGPTHGIAALVVLPFVVAAVVLLWDRLVRRRRRPENPPARPLALVGLAAIGVASHPALDWVNTYGMRWLLPFDGRWSYGDAVFIVDPWLWLLLGGATFLSWSKGGWALARWATLASVLTAAVVLSGAVPAPARALWLAGIGLWVAARAGMRGRDRARTNRSGAQGRIAARLALGAAGVYVAAMVGQTAAAERAVAQAAHEKGWSVTDLMVGPVPADPFGGRILIQTAEAYHTGTFRWTRSAAAASAVPRVVWDERAIPRLTVVPGATPRVSGQVVRAAHAHPDVRRYLVWARFPFHRVEARDDGWWVEVRDARYPDGSGGGLAGIGVWLSSDLEPVRTGPPGSTPLDGGHEAVPPTGAPASSVPTSAQPPLYAGARERNPVFEGSRRNRVGRREPPGLPPSSPLPEPPLRP